MIHDVISKFLVNIVKQGYVCTRCDHKWIPKNKVKLPKECPKCMSPYWNKPRRKKRSI